MAYRGQPGISVGIVYDQELIWSHGFGFRDIQNKIPATPQTTYPIASITKLFTATAVLQLRDAGKLQLDDPVVKHLPWFKVRNEDEDGPVGETLVFELAPDGKVTRMKVGANYRYPVP